MYWFLAGAGLLVLGLILYWLLVTTEGVFLGPHIVIWLYDITASRYDHIKEFDADDDRFFIARPITHALAGIEMPLVLDVATGTGRVPLALARSREFTGFVVGLDPSMKMLAEALKKPVIRASLSNQKTALVRQRADPLPFADETFDLVSCLEALEFFPSGSAAVDEMVRVLKPGGMLLISRRRGNEARLFFHRYQSREAFRAMLMRCGLVDVRINLWEVNYDLVIARKPVQ